MKGKKLISEKFSLDRHIFSVNPHNIPALACTSCLWRLGNLASNYILSLSDSCYNTNSHINPCGTGRHGEALHELARELKARKYTVRT